MFNYEMIRYNQGLDANIILHSVNRYKLHWHTEIEVLMVLDGSIGVNVNGSTHELKEGDIFILNSGDVHSTIGNGKNIVAAIQIHPIFWERTMPDIQNINFIWPSKIKNKIYDLIRSIVSNIIREYYYAESGYHTAIEGLLCELLVLMVRGIPYKEKDNLPDDGRLKELSLIQRIMKYIRKHYSENITIEDISEEEHLSVEYLSEFIENKMGITFESYVKNVRLHYAVKLLTKMDKSMEEIADKCGFDNERDFSTTFRKFYNMTPGDYRRKYVLSTKDKQDLQQNTDYLGYNFFQVMDKIKTFVSDTKINESETIDTIGIVEEERIIQTDCISIGSLFENWNKIGCIPKAYDILRLDVQEQIKEAVKYLNITLLRFSGIFDYKMQIYQEEPDGNIICNWWYVDKIIDFIIKIGIHPMINFNFTEEKLKLINKENLEDDIDVLFENEILRWEGQVYSLVYHCVDRYGISEVKKWYFEVCSNYDSTIDYMDIDNYIIFLSATYRAINRVNKKLHLASSSPFQPVIEQNQWFDIFLQKMRDANIKFDCHTYCLTAESLSKINDLIPFLSSKNASVINIREKDEHIVFIQPSREFFSTEFDIRLNKKTCLLDTMFSACYVLDSYLNNQSYVNSIVFSNIIDASREGNLTSQYFSGGCGLMTIDGVKKPSWYALEFLEELAEEILYQEKNYIVTRSQEGIQVLCFNYMKYKIPWPNNNLEEDFEDIPNNATSNLPLTLCFHLQKLYGKYEIRTKTLNSDYGSAFDIYQNMGEPKNLRKEDIEYLRSIAKPHLHIKTIHLTGQYKINLTLQPQEVCLIKLKKL